ncbi:MAG TPA: ABC transporter permease [Bryobacteraceae bacterium]|nr:ABC transporter permease [Bryobacteraceae bacterium]
MERLLPGRVRALMRKEFNQIRRDKRLAFSLILPPAIQLLVFGFALDASVSNLRLGVVDDSRTPESRELVAALTESKSFRSAGTYLSVNDLGAAIGRGDLDAGLAIPYTFARDLQRGGGASVQFLLNAVNANTAAIGQGYAEGVIQSYNRTLAGEGIHLRIQPVAGLPAAERGQVSMRTAFLYNPGLVSAWFIVTGTFGVLLILNGSLVASAAMVKEREMGTVEQLLMTPASTGEIIIAKITPLFVLLMMMVLFATGLMKAVFDVPIRGSLLLVLAGAALCVLSGIGIGTFIATFTKSAQQAQLTSFFINPPVASLSGALTPVEAMPRWLQPWTLLNPVRHFAIITRGVLVRGSGLDVLWPNFLVLAAFTALLVSLSVWRFRKQLG